MSKVQRSAGKIIRSAEANMKAEGFSISAKAKKDCHAMLKGQVSANTLIGQYVANYKSKS